MSELPEHVRRNRALWDDWAQKFAAPGEEGWARDTPTWGIWHVSESQVAMLPDDPSPGNATAESVVPPEPEQVDRVGASAVSLRADSLPA